MAKTDGMKYAHSASEIFIWNAFNRTAIDVIVRNVLA